MKGRLLSCFVLMFFYSCSHVSMLKKSESYPYDRSELVSVGAALNLAQNSYLKGCVDAVQMMDEEALLERGEALSLCREHTENYMQDVLYIMDSEVEKAPGTNRPE